MRTFTSAFFQSCSSTLLQSSFQKTLQTLFKFLLQTWKANLHISNCQQLFKNVTTAVIFLHTKYNCLITLFNTYRKETSLMLGCAYSHWKLYIRLFQTAATIPFHLTMSHHTHTIYWTQQLIVCSYLLNMRLGNWKWVQVICCYSLILLYLLTLQPQYDLSSS